MTKITNKKDAVVPQKARDKFVIWCLGFGILFIQPRIPNSYTEDSL
jgi:hypothetical protein